MSTRVVERALELGPESAAAFSLRGQVLEAQGKFREAAESFNVALGVSEAQRQRRRSSDMKATSAVLAAAVVSGIVGTAGAQDGEWVDVKLVEGVNSPFLDWGPAVSADGLEMYFSSSRPPASGGRYGTGLFVARRDSTEVPFGEPAHLPDLSSASADDFNPNLSGDGLVLYFNSVREEGRGGKDIWKATRAAIGAPFGEITNGEELEEINSPENEEDLTVSRDGLTAVFQRGGFCCRRGCCTGGDLYIATRDVLTEPFANVRPISAARRPDGSLHRGGHEAVRGVVHPR